MDIALRIVRIPIFALVEGRVEIQEVREETTGGDLAGQLVKIVVTVFRQIAYASFLFPYLDGEDGGFSVSYPLIGAFQQLADDAAPLGRGVCAVVDGAEHHLVAAA